MLQNKKFDDQSIFAGLAAINAPNFFLVFSSLAAFDYSNSAWQIYWAFCYQDGFANIKHMIELLHIVQKKINFHLFSPNQSSQRP